MNSTIRVLLVEDHPDTARVMQRVLQSLGHHVTVAASVQEAVACLNRETFSLLISDIGLPDGSGLDVVRAMKTIQPMPSMAVTGFGMDADLQRSHEAGFDAHVTKPMDIPRLSELITTLTKPHPTAS